MSIDALGRVVVGSGHFMGQVAVAGQHVIVGGGHIFEQISQAGQNVVVRGSHMPTMGERIVTASQTAVIEPHIRPYMELQVKNAVKRVIGERFPNSAPSPYDPERFRGIPSSGNPNPTNSQEEEQWKLLYEASKDILEGAGWALSGDLQAALQKELDAALKLGEVYLNDFKYLLNPPQQ